MLPFSINNKKRMNIVKKEEIYNEDELYLASDTDSDDEFVKLEPDYVSEYYNSEIEEPNKSTENKYVYDILPLLNNDLSTIQSYNSIQLCIYNINNNSLTPFLEFYLIKNLFLNSLEFPSLYTKDVIIDIDLFLEKCFSKKEKYVIHGYKKHDNNTYVFIYIYSSEHLLVNNQTCYLALVDEIMNLKHIDNIKIDNNITDFFLNNTDFLYIRDPNYKIYEVPIVAYQGIEERLMMFTFMFGLSKSDFTNLMGPYFYFTNYQNVLLNFNNKKIKYGVIRYALFLGAMKIPMNFLDDEEDSSSIKKELLTRSNNKKALLTMRISDHDGKWTNMFDSVYIGRTQLDDGSLLEDTPTWVIKNYNQQYSLSYKIVVPKIKIG